MDENVLTVQHESVPPHIGVGHEPLYPRPVQGRPLGHSQVGELARPWSTPGLGQALGQVRVRQTKPEIDD